MIIKRTVGGERVTLNVLPPPFADELWQRWLKHVEAHEDSIIGFDVETTAIDEVLGPFEPDAKLRLVQFGSRKYAWALDPHDKFWRPRIKALLESGDGGDGYRFVSHTNFDPLWARREFDVPIDDKYIDTHVLAGLLFPGVTEKKNLKDLCDKYIDTQLSEAEAALIARFKELAPTGERVGKKLKSWGFTNIDLHDPIFGTYAGLDAIYVRRLLDILSAKLKAYKDNRLNRLSRREQRLARLTTQMRYRGLRVDQEWTAALLNDIGAEYDQAEARLTDTVGCKAFSPKLGDWLIDHDVRFLEVTATGLPKLTMPSAAADGTLPELAERYADDPVVGPVLADRLTLGTHKNMRANLRIILAQSRNDGRAHPQINTQAAHTGRMSIIKPAMQTLKKRDPRLRGCFISDDGTLLVGADYQGQENRIAAAFSRDENMLRIVRENLNQHSETAKLIFGDLFVDKTSVRNTITGQTFYDCSKTLDFAQNYGARPKRIAQQLGISKAEATELWLAWREAYAGLVEWTERIGKARVIVNPWGRRVPADPWRDYASGNYAIQSTGRDILGDAIDRLDSAGWAVALWLPVHDELILQVPEDDAELAAQALTECMTTRLNGVDFPATGEIIGTRWGVAE